MGKLTFKTGFGANDGKTLTKPFTYNGKTYNKITLKSGFGTSDGKVLTLEKQINHFTKDMYFGNVNNITNVSILRLNLGVENNLIIKNDDNEVNVSLTIKNIQNIFGTPIPTNINDKYVFKIDIKDTTIVKPQSTGRFSITAYTYTNNNILLPIINTFSSITRIFFTPVSKEITLLGGHTYLFENGKDPVDLGEYETTTPSIKTITANMYSSAVISSHYNIAISFTDTSVWDALHPGAVTTTLLPEKIIFEVKEEIEVLPYVYFTLINITTHKGFNVNYSGNGFTLKAGHKYQFENGKDPVDLGTY